MERYIATFRRTVSFVVNVDQVAKVTIMAPDRQAAADAAWRLAADDSIDDYDATWVEDGQRLATNDEVIIEPRPYEIRKDTNGARLSKIVDACKVLNLDPNEFIWGDHRQ